MMPVAFLFNFEDSNPSKKQAVEHWLLSDVDDTQQKKQCVICFRNHTSFYSAILPDTRKWQPEFKSRVYSTIVDRDMKEDLMKGGLINWCVNVRSLLPVQVPKDGNCLLHAVAVAVWAISDKSLMLRRLLALALSVNQDRFRGRWVRHRQMQITQFMDKLLESGGELMDKEWAEVRQCLEPDRSHSAAVPYRFLESIHVYALANILRRPIIVLTDPTIHTFTGLSLQDNDMGGIYLPLEWNWRDTSRVPILLGYSHSHFCPLLFAEHPNQALVETTQKRNLAPLVNSKFEQFPVRFLVQGEEPDVGVLLRKYLRVKETVMQVNDRVQNVLCAEVEVSSLPAELNLVGDYVQDCVQRFHQERTLSSAHQLPYSTGVSPQAGAVKQECLHLSASSQAHVLPQNVRREQLQKVHGPVYGLADPTLHSVGGLRQHLIQIPPPNVTPVRSCFDEQSVSLNPSPEKKCVVPTCKFFGDPDLAMMCSSCFKNKTIRESRQMASSGKMQRPVPTAPLASMPVEERLQLSMMRESCKEKCGYRCSTKTYPYCHECASKRQRQTQEKTMAAASESALAPIDPVRSAVESTTGHGPMVMQPIHMAQESRKTAENISHENLNAAQSISSGSQSPVRGALSGAAEAGSAFPKNISLLPAEETLKEARIQILVTGELSCPLSAPEDPSVMLLFGSGQAVSASSGHPGQVAPSPGTQPQGASSSGLTPAPEVTQLPAELEAGGAEKNSLQTQSSAPDIQHFLGHDVRELTSAARMAKSQMQSVGLGGAGGEAKAVCASPHCSEQAVHKALCASPHCSEQAVHKALCASPHCSEQAVHKALCGKCYMSQGMGNTEPASPQQNMNMMSIHSTTSSAPASVGPVASVPKSSATYTKEAAAFVLPESKSQPSSLRDLNNIPHMNYVHNWLHENRIVEHQVGLGENTVAPSGLKSLPQGLPEKQESEALGNDLIASGLECFSSTQRCIGEGCGNAVQQAEKLCQQCQDILRHARLGLEASASVKAEQRQPEQQSCRTKGCTYFGIQQNLGYCSDCYRKHVEREMEEKNQHSSQVKTGQSPSSTRTPPHTITVPPEFHYVRTPLERQGRYCTSAGCRLFGDPEQAGMCFAHYQQHLTSICKAARTMIATKQGTVITNIPYASEVRITPTSATFTSGDVFPPPQVSVLSVPPPSYSTGSGGPARSQEPSLGETYNRVVGRQMGKCLNPSCSNYGNRSEGGLCNSCAQDQKVTDDQISRTIYGHEETG